MQLKAQKLLVKNEVNMKVLGSEMPLYLPVQAVRYTADKVVCEIQHTEFEFDFAQILDVLSTSLTRNQKQEIFGIDFIDRRGDERIEGDLVRTYGTTGNDTELVLVRSGTHKAFSITKWPTWLPEMNIHIRHAIASSKSWKSVETIVSGLIGAIIRGGKSNSVG
jgi:hypothetical protein